MQLLTRFNLGDEVFSANTAWQKYHVTCEECNGTGIVKIATAKESYDSPCPYCDRDIFSDKSNGFLVKYKFQPLVQRLTIGEIRIEHSHEKNRVQYMCKETGIGSGTLHDEERFFETLERAQQHAEALSKAAQLDRDTQDTKNEKRKRQNVRANKKRGV